MPIEQEMRCTLSNPAHNIYTRVLVFLTMGVDENSGLTPTTRVSQAVALSMTVPIVERASALGLPLCHRSLLSSGFSLFAGFGSL